MDFYNGQQHNVIASSAVAARGRRYYCEMREVFNHIAPMVEARLARLAEVEVQPVCLPDIEYAEYADEVAGKCERVLEGALRKVNFEALREQANTWVELTGTAFYKVTWNKGKGKYVGEVSGELLREGDIEVTVCSPFEIYPSDVTAAGVETVGSIIHAKAYKISDIYELFGKSVSGGEVDVFALTCSARAGGMSQLSDAAVGSERYEMPSHAYPAGRLVIVSGGKLLYKGNLPYLNGRGDTRALPFIRQCGEAVVGSFFGRSVIERAIPVQRAYNSVKNRKAEFINRLACGVLSVEEGSVDLESLENEGIAPGRVIVYRQGAAEPKFMDTGSVPVELEHEEDRLLSEFAAITGVADAGSYGNANLSATALQIMADQGNLRMKRAVLGMVHASAGVAEHILRLYRQFATGARLERGAGEVFCFEADELLCDAVVMQEKQPTRDAESAEAVA
jgi:hypothetical protein